MIKNRLGGCFSFVNLGHFLIFDYIIFIFFERPCQSSRRDPSTAGSALRSGIDWSGPAPFGKDFGDGGVDGLIHFGGLVLVEVFPSPCSGRRLGANQSRQAGSQVTDGGGEFELLFKGFGLGEGFLEVGEGLTQGCDLTFEGEALLREIS
jgi:hypothetical protein